MRGIAWAIAGMMALLLLALALVDWNALKGPIGRFASARSGRTVAIGGNLEVHLFSPTPQVTVGQLTIGNPPWEKGPSLLEVQRLQIQLKLLPLLKGDVILPRVAVLHPRIYLHRDAQGQANWTFESQQPTSASAHKPAKLPVVRDFLVEDGEIVLRDEILHLDAQGTLVAHEKKSNADPQAFRVNGKGTVNRKPFELRVAGGPLINVDPDRPYPFDLQVRAGDIHVASQGEVAKPFDLGHLRLQVKAQGGDLADLYYLTQLALPNTPPFALSASIERKGKQFEIETLSGKVGRSDLSGNLAIDISGRRPAISGTLTSQKLRLKDLAASLGTEAATTGTLEGKAEPPKPSKKGAQAAPPAKAPLFPDARLQVNRIRAMDADVKFSAQSIEAGKFPFKRVALRVQLDNGVLSLAPFQFELPQGKLAGTARIDARGRTPQSKIDLRIQDVELDQLKGKAPDAEPPLGGTVQARVALAGEGDSVHDFMADADGRVSLVLPHGEVRAAFAELTGINVARGLGLLMKGDEERTGIRCGVAEFTVKDGTAHSDQVIFDTKNVRISAHGEVRLGPEELDLSVKGEPKKLRLARLRTPIDIGGHLRKPKIGIDAGKALKQGAIATALGAIAAPVAAVLAFIDPGLAKDENCAALLAGTQPVRPPGAAPPISH